jgi:hypothetical protein
MKRVLALMSVMLLAGRLAAAQPNPIVKMTVTLPDGQSRALSAPESGLATLTLGDGTEIGVRPTILDSNPWMRVVVTFFRMPTAAHAAEEIGSVEVRTGGPAVRAKTNPVFKVAVLSVSEPPAATAPTSTQ